jgi:hypothetical protein
MGIRFWSRDSIPISWIGTNESLLAGFSFNPERKRGISIRQISASVNKRFRFKSKSGFSRYLKAW